jgi:hypothetical protein
MPRQRRISVSAFRIPLAIIKIAKGLGSQCNWAKKGLPIAQMDARPENGPYRRLTISFTINIGA